MRLATTAHMRYGSLMDSLATAPTMPTNLPQLPRWALSHGRAADDADAAFAAGIALNCLDNLVRTAPAWAGCWRARQAYGLSVDSEARHS